MVDVPTNAIGSLGLTKQRTAVLQVIRESEGHLTANEVFENARRILPSISFATVYNSLHYLKNESLIGEVTFGNDASRYDRNLTRHYHAICNDCGKLVDLDLRLTWQGVDAVLADQFAIDAYGQALAQLFGGDRRVAAFADEWVGHG